MIAMLSGVDLRLIPRRWELAQDCTTVGNRILVHCRDNPLQGSVKRLHRKSRSWTLWCRLHGSTSAKYLFVETNQRCVQHIKSLNRCRK